MRFAAVASALILVTAVRLELCLGAGSPLT